MVSFTLAKAGSSRVFLIEGRARGDHQPLYQSSMKAGSPSQDFGDIEKIEAPSTFAYGKFVEIGSIRGAAERVTMTLTGRYAADLKSQLLRMARAGCALDVQVNFGACTDPTDYNTFTKKLVFENAFLTNWEAEDLGALGSDEEAKIDESADISAVDVYELLPISWGEKGGTVVTNELIDLALCDTASCGDCETESDGCEKFFAISAAAGGSPSTPADVVFSLDGGATWQAHDIESLSASDVPDAITCLGQYLVVVSEDTDSLHYALISEHDGTTDPDWTEVTTGFVAAGAPRAIRSNPEKTKAFIAGAGGYIYSTTDPTSGVTVLDAGVSWPLATYNAISVLSEEFAVAVGNAGVIAKTENGVSWTAVTTFPGGVGVDITAVAVKSENEWLIGTSAGTLYITYNGGVTWNLKGFPGSGTGTVEYIDIPNDTVIFISHTTTTPLGRILQSTNGGYDWVVMPSGTATLTANDRINAVVACRQNSDTVVGVGLHDNGADGIIVQGTE